MQLFFLLLCATGPVANGGTLTYFQPVGADANVRVGVLAFAKPAGGVFSKGHQFANINITATSVPRDSAAFFKIVVGIKLIWIAFASFTNWILVFAATFTCRWIIIMATHSVLKLAKILRKGDVAVAFKRIIIQAARRAKRVNLADI